MPSSRGSSRRWSNQHGEPRAVPPGSYKGPAVLALEREAHGLADRLPEILIDASGSLRRSPMACTAVVAPVPARRSGNSGNSRRATRASHRLAALGELRPSLSSRARVGGGSHHVAVARPFALDEFPQPPRADEQARPRTGHHSGRAELLVRSGERVALMGLTVPTASRKATTRIAETLAANIDAPS